jgi:CheY-like chemotaxis protein
MFSQGPHAATGVQGGLGIGLWLSQQLMEMHGGTIEATSEGQGKGSRFTLVLPIQTRQAAERPRTLAPAAGETPPMRVLVVEDNVDGAATLADLLRNAGNTVEVAHDGRRGIELARAFHPAVMLLDIGLPKMDGYDVCRLIRRQPWGKDMLVVAMTGWGQDNDRRKAKNAGFDAHLVKPVDFAALNEVLKRRSTTATNEPV